MTGESSLAVALHYEKQDGGAPRVVASGRGAVGDKIVEIAKAHGVPIESNPGLAAALADVEIGEEIPVELYKAVAEVLIFILRMSGQVQ
jgi:flagellar biosynthesis protein